MRSLLIASCCILALSACAPNLPPAPTASSGPYRLDSGDRVRVIVYNEQSLSTEYSVDDNGIISFPMLGPIPARSATIQELQKLIADGLVKKGILTNPGVSVEVSVYRPFFILGEVGKPGQYPYTADLNVLSAVAIAGGFTVRADKNAVSMVRTENGSPTEWHADRLTKLRPGDVVTVPERFP